MLSCLAQLVERKTLYLVVVGSRPTVGVLLLFVGVGVVVQTLRCLELKTCAVASWLVG